MTIEVMYTCIPCVLVDVKLNVRARNDGEDIRDWMDYLTRQIAHDHQRRSPGCKVDKMTNCKIPIQDESGIGFPRTQ